MHKWRMAPVICDKNRGFLPNHTNVSSPRPGRSKKLMKDFMLTALRASHREHLSRSIEMLSLSREGSGHDRFEKPKHNRPLHRNFHRWPIEVGTGCFQIFETPAPPALYGTSGMRLFELTHCQFVSRSVPWSLLERKIQCIQIRGRIEAREAREANSVICAIGG